MGAEVTADAVETPPLKPLELKSRLASTPASGPKWSVNVKDAAGNDVAVADPRATRAAVALMDIHAVVGGAACHWGGPAAFAEANAAIHSIIFAAEGEWYDSFNYINDAGHAENGVYALRANWGFDNLGLDDIKKFRSIESKLTGHGESHLNPEGVLLSNGPLGSSLPQAQGLALADKVAGNDRTTICVMSDGASMEGEAKEAFAAIPGLAAKGMVSPFVMVVSDNDTKLSGRITADSFSMQPTFEAMDDLGWEVVKVDNGHDLQAVYSAIEKAVADVRANSIKPVCVWLKTIKGYGIKATEDHSAGGHGFPLKNGEKAVDWVNEIYGGELPAEFTEWANTLRSEWEASEEAKKAASDGNSAPAVKKDKVQSGLAAGAVKAAQEGYPVYSISSDVQGSTGIAAFQKAVAGRHIEVGIAEANMVSTGAGFSKVGFVPIVDTFGQFGVTKGNLPLTMAALSQAPVIAMFSHVGFQDAADGASHQATTYYAAVSAIPHTVVITPSCAGEAEALMYEAIKRFAEDRKAGKDGESYVFFVGRESYPIHWLEKPDYKWGKAQVIREGSDVVIVGSGVLFSRTLDAAEKLAEKGISATVINNPFTNRVDVETIGAAVEKCGGRLVTIEDHQTICGMGAQISHALSQAGIAHRVKSLGIPGEFGQSAYMAAELYDRYGLNAEKLVESAEELMK